MSRSSCGDDKDALVWTRLLRAVLSEPTTSLRQIGTSTTELEQQLRAIDALTTPQALQQCLVAAMATELVSAVDAAAMAPSRGMDPAKVFEASSVLSGLFGVRINSTT